ncbi:MAG: nucleoside deaminase [Nitriliruptoraceae bacterium]
MTPGDLTHLRRALELAGEARAAGDRPFGALLVSGDGEVLREERNTVNTDRDVAAHPELKLARWAGQHLDADDRARATVYTSCEHCPMCAVGHANAGLGRLVFAIGGRQRAELMGESGWRLSVQELFDRGGITTVVDGPATELSTEARRLYEG